MHHPRIPHQVPLDSHLHSDLGARLWFFHGNWCAPFSLHLVCIYVLHFAEGMVDLGNSWKGRSRPDLKAVPTPWSVPGASQASHARSLLCTTLDSPKPFTPQAGQLLSSQNLTFLAVCICWCDCWFTASFLPRERSIQPLTALFLSPVHRKF